MESADRIETESAVTSFHSPASVELLAKVTSAVDAVWTDYDCIGLRLQSGAEMRTKIGQVLRPSNHWVDGVKTRRKMRGTACFYIHRIGDVARVLDALCHHGYSPRNDSGRLVVIGSNRGTDADSEQMPEAYSVALREAVLLAVI